MKVPKIKIVWEPLMQHSHEFKVREITNGYLVGNTYVATKEGVITRLSNHIRENL